MSRRDSPNCLAKLQSMNERFDQTFGVWKKDALTMIKNKEDQIFLESMKSDRAAFFEGVDKKKADQDRRKAKHLQEETSRQERHEATKELEMKSNVWPDNCASSDNWEESEEMIAERQKKRSHHISTYAGTRAFIPHDILKRPKVVSVAARLNITSLQQAALTKAVIEEAGGDLHHVAKSYSTADKVRRSTAKVIAKNVQKNWIPPTAATLHWNGKQVQTLANKNLKEERLPVLVGNATDVKLLGAAQYNTGSDFASGEIIAEHTRSFLESWNCKQSIVSLCFDTTAATTGHVTAACVTIQSKLDRALLWCVCRHHIGEVILDHVFEGLMIEVTKSPEISLFKRFQKHWQHITLAEYKSLANNDIREYNKDAQQLLLSCKSKTLSKIHTSASYCRENYKEMAQLRQAVLDDNERKHGPI